MSAETEGNRPNEYGFAGGATGPEPTPDRADSVDREDVEVPADDLTGALSEGLDDVTDSDAAANARP
ncbi:hypothetical protein [Jidongwangia harbinensis]|uniref:hypothetical protein n=1 Tax=Jidongwangia harbinensis TaxID=2878561 RepID=UPI001CDA41D9|nr:hypothetical protein [Jidongwangia harbinensis]MCA2213861.1 hypothetical protein [Jidongwangia harbinensis]